MDEEAPPELSARHLLVCQQLHHDPFQAGASYSLRGLIVFLQPKDDIGYPLVAESLVPFAQVFGGAGRFEFWVELLLLGDDDAEEHVATFGPTTGLVRGGQFVDALTIPLWNVPFPRPGLYEFRLRRDELSDPLISERLFLKD